MFVAIPTLGSREDAQVYALRRIEKKYADKIELVYPYEQVTRIFHDFARNQMVDEFLASDCDILWFVDADIIPPDSILDLIVEHGDKWKLAGGVYPVWMPPAGQTDKQIVFTVYRKYNDKICPSIDVPMSGTDFVAGLATGCLFIRREIFAELKRPFFEFKYNETTRDLVEGEDLGFCRKVSDLGHQFFVDFSLACHHMKKVSLLEMNNYAMQYAQRCIANHERAIRQAIAKKKLAKLSQPKSNLILSK